MDDKTLLLKFISREFNNEHPVTYIYVCGQKRSEKTAIEQAMKLLTKIFGAIYTDFFILEVFIEYMNYKKYLYKKGIIEVKKFYF